MEIIFLNHVSDTPQSEIKPCVMALGFFDGIHLGHQKLIEKAKQIALQKNLELAVLTFFPHPKEILTQMKFNYLISLESKIDILRKMGVERLYVARFTKEFASLEPEVFVKEFLITFQVKEVVAGFDFTYGNRGLGTMQTLEEHGKGAFQVNMISKVEQEGKKISSTLIRDLLNSGQIDQIAHFLGDHYQTKGHFIHFFPLDSLKTTSRIRYYISAFNTLPSAGIYEVDALIKDQWVRCISHVYETKKGTVKVEMELPREMDININNHEKVTIKWLKECTVTAEKRLKQLNG
jgi:riboflavin kinase/FMN adenylyltransferase